MNWKLLNTHGESQERAFEIVCEQLFHNWSKDEFGKSISAHTVVNGSGGDGGVESYVTLTNGNVVGLQAKWFLNSIQASQFSQIKKSIKTAISVHPRIKEYIVCVPRDLADKTNKGENTEKNRWNKLVENIGALYPEVKIILWGDYTLQCELQKPSSQGILKYWFGMLPISMNTINFAFLKSKQSWLVTKYVPEINTFGSIYREISSFCGNNEEYGAVLHQARKMILLCNDFIESVQELKGFDTSELEDVFTEASSVLRQISSLKDVLQSISNWIMNPELRLDALDSEVFDIRAERLTDILHSKSYTGGLYFHLTAVSNCIEKIIKNKPFDLFIRFKTISNSKNLVFIGDPGTGKTHGVAAVTERMIEEGFHIPILIRAKDIKPEESWLNIIESNLGLPFSHTEDELLQALEAMVSHIGYEKKMLDDHLYVIPKVLIMVDGLDESDSQQRWIERIGEAQTITDSYSLIRFCFTSRPYAIPTNIGFAKVIRLSTSGDVPVSKLFDSYIKQYDIEIQDTIPYKYGLTTPLSLKLFCEIYKGSKIESSTCIDISLATLLRRKIDLLETAFSSHYHIDNKAQYVIRAIRLLAILFTNNSVLKRDDVVKHLMSNLAIGEDLGGKIVLYLEEYGIISSYYDHSISPLKTRVYYYSPGIKGYFDYVSSLLLLERYSCPGSIDFNECSAIDRDTLYGLSLISIQKFGYLLVDNATISKVANEQLKTELFFYSLRNIPFDFAERFVDMVIRIMNKNACSLFRVVNEVILPLSRIRNHPLGAELLDRFLKSFAYPALRDVIWSQTGYLKNDFDKKWSRMVALRLLNDEYRLNLNDTHDGCPLIYAWALSALNNSLRKDYRIELMRWGLMRPEEFFLLFKKFALVDDSQIQSDMFSILMSLVFESDNELLTKESAVWIAENILNKENIDNFRNVSIRYYSIAIVRRAEQLGLLKKDFIRRLLPPYTVKSDTILLNKEALVGTKNGYKCITYDLARYVLVDKIASKFYSTNSEERANIDNYINTIVKKNTKINADITFENFIMSAAFAYIESKGWSENECENLGKDDDSNVMGDFDRDIIISYYHADHGSHSQVMTVCEKYVWQARDEIFGFLSDRLELGGRNGYVRDYGLLSDFLIPIQELQQINVDEEMTENQWFVPEPSFVMNKTHFKDSKEAIELIANAPSIDWRKWIFSNEVNGCHVVADTMAVLYSYSHFVDNCMETTLFTNSIIIDNNNLPLLFKLIEDPEYVNSIAHPEDLCGTIDSDCYITPKEVCWFDWKEHINSSYLEKFPFSVYPAVDWCCYNFIDCGDVYYYLPSEELRKVLGIISSNGYLSYDKNKQIKAEYCIVGDRYGAAQSCLWVDIKTIINQLSKENKKLLWIMRDYRRESGIALEKVGKFYADNDRIYIGYYEDEIFKTKFIYPKK